MMQRVTAFRLGWNIQTKTGGAQLQLEHGRMVNVPIESAAELCAVAAILKESPVFLNDGAFLVTGPEPISDADFRA